MTDPKTPKTVHAMTGEQFEHLAALMNTKVGASKRIVGLRLILVEGLTSYAAAKQVGLNHQNLTDALDDARDKVTHALAFITPGVRMPAKRVISKVGVNPVNTDKQD